MPEVNEMQSAPAPVLQLADVCVEHRAAHGASRPILASVSMSLRPGEIFGLVGETGSGKSMTARAVMGVLPSGVQRTGGVISFRGTPLQEGRRSSLSAVRGTALSFVPQDLRGALHPTLPILRQFKVLLRKNCHLPAPEIARRAAECLSQCGIRDVHRVLKSYAHELSGGMAQRVAIALALALDADVLIADEPTTGCDTTVQRQILDILRDGVKTHRRSMLLITHDLGVVATYCDTVAVMRSGRILESGPTRRVLDQPTDPYTRSLADAARFYSLSAPGAQSGDSSRGKADRER